MATLEASTLRSHIKEAKLSASKKKGNILSQAMLWQKCKWFGRGCQSRISMGRGLGLTSEPVFEEVVVVKGATGVCVPRQESREE